MGDRVTSVIGSAGSEETISRYLSWSKGDIDKNIGEKIGSRVPAESPHTSVRPHRTSGSTRMYICLYCWARLGAGRQLWYWYGR